LYYQHAVGDRNVAIAKALPVLAGRSRAVNPAAEWRDESDDTNEVTSKVAR
jgi:hypothetical protein